MNPKEVIGKMDIEISFYINQIKEKMKSLSQYERYIAENKDYIRNNPDKEAEFFEYAYRNYHSYFPYLINNSLLVAFDSYLEYKLQFINNEFSIKKVKKTGSDIEFYNDNILANYSIDISGTKKDWIIINDFHSIRNKIVHNNSSLSKKIHPSPFEIKKIRESDIYSILLKYKKYLEYHEFTTRFYIIDDELLIFHLYSIKDYLTNILQQIPPLSQRIL